MDNKQPFTDDSLRAATLSWGVPDLDLDLLRHALKHTSALAPHSLESNERLEFLGDSIVNAATAHYLYTKYPEWNEGDLAKGRALVVSKLSLYEAGKRLGLPELIVVGSNTLGALARGRRSLAADAVEAVVAAVYLQQGWASASAFVLRILEPELAGLTERVDLRDSKTILQERAQSLHETPPQYAIIDQTGNPHDRVFTARVTVQNGESAEGIGRSKKDAQQAAANALIAALDAKDEA